MEESHQRPSLCKCVSKCPSELQKDFVVLKKKHYERIEPKLTFSTLNCWLRWISPFTSPSFELVYTEHKNISSPNSSQSGLLEGVQFSSLLQYQDVADSSHPFCISLLSLRTDLKSIIVHVSK